MGTRTLNLSNCPRPSIGLVNTFRSGSALKRVLIPNANPEINAKAFEPDLGVTIVGVAGSYTDKYAKGMGLSFEAYEG